MKPTIAWPLPSVWRRHRCAGSLQLATPPRTPLPFLPPLVLLVAVSVALSIWAALRIVAPLSRFAAAVEKFGLAGQGGPLPEEGPAEIRRATGAFNRMRERILRLMEDRTQMMMAISHDLRTPLTRLRLRAEDVDDRDLQRGMLRDIELMESSISDAVSNLRAVTGQEARQRADLPSLLETICGEFADAGFSVEYEGPQARLLAASTSGYACCYESGAERDKIRISRRRAAKRARVSRGTDRRRRRQARHSGYREREAVLEPFYRSDPARQQAGGFGLGLAIALEVARDHAGTLTLHDLTPHGLCARLRLALHQSQKLSRTVFPGAALTKPRSFRSACNAGPANTRITNNTASSRANSNKVRRPIMRLDVGAGGGVIEVACLSYDIRIKSAETMRAAMGRTAAAERHHTGDVLRVVILLLDGAWSVEPNAGQVSERGVKPLDDRWRQ